MSKMLDRNELAQAYRNAQAARRALARALRRRNTYRGAVKEALWASVNLAMYPAGVLAEKLEPDTAASLAGRFVPELPLRYLDPEAAGTPIILVHGYFHNRSAFMVLRRALRRAGFRHVTTVNYNVIGHDVEQLAGQLARHVDHVLEETGATKVHIVGHSLGGLVARAYIQLCGGEDKVHTCVTLGTPHHGTYSAFVGRGKAARDLRPGSPLIDRLEEAHESKIRFVCYYSNLDAMVIPAGNAKLSVAGLHAQNVLVKDLGHMSLLISQQLIASIIDTLWHLDRPVATVTPISAKAREIAAAAEEGSA
jgi:triacylglycerol esterase/lipase EstA (alpha/beta hydrolase family)